MRTPIPLPWLVIPGVAVDLLLVAGALRGLWVNPGRPVASGCCGWAYQSYENYRLMAAAVAVCLVAMLAGALALRRWWGWCLLLVYAAPIVVVSFVFLVAKVSE